MKRYFAPVIFAFFCACNGGTSTDSGAAGIDSSLIPKPAPQIGYNIVNVYPHDTTSYTQGLQLYKGKMYEGTGDYERSALMITDYKTGKIEKKHPVGTKQIFGEGITIFNNKLYQLTWQNNIVYVYDVNNTDKAEKTFTWPYAGWGITHNGTDLIISDGSANLYFVNAADFKVKKRITVTEDGVPMDRLNELEFIDGFVYANVYQDDFILKINPADGKVTGKISLPGIIEKYAPGYIPEPEDEVLNGIAYDSASKKLFITGKRWPKLFEITLNN